MTADKLLNQLSQQGRVLLLGGLAVIAHGLSRATRDIDVWLEPFSTPDEWSGVVKKVLTVFPAAQPYDLRERRTADLDDVVRIISRDGVLRISGLDRPLDIFRTPHNLESAEFDLVWNRASITMDRVRVPDEIDLLVTKEETSRSQDIADISFLEDKIRKRLCRTLVVCSRDEANEVFARYSDHATCRAALENPDPQVRDMAIRTLRTFARDGDPFAEQILKEHV